ncbi:MAG: ATP-dependent Lon protease, partial [Chloroflexi bacterium]|nr:ATP-dependent Lon protease [Chloroflexota bacterium]
MHADLFDDLPAQYYDSAFLDRIHFYIPGWEVEIIRGEMFSEGYGFVVDYLAEILRTLRNYDFTQKYDHEFQLLSDISTRDRDGINKTFSGLMKILFPHGEASRDEIEMMLRFAIEGRKRVKDQLMRIDTTYTRVNFEYQPVDGGPTQPVKTLEEKTYPQHYYKYSRDETETGGLLQDDPDAESQIALPEQRLTFEENQRGASFDTLFGPYLEGAQKITITDPDMTALFQARNLMKFIETIIRQKSDAEQVTVHLITLHDECDTTQQLEHFEQIQINTAPAGIHFTWEFVDTIPERHVVTDHGWKILLDRGLDIFNRCELGDAFALTNRLQRYRPLKGFQVTYLRVDEG